MISAPIKVDGKEYDLAVTSMKRTFAVMDSDKTERLQSTDMFRDVLGTFYNYAITMESSSQKDYDAFYEAISEPVDFHLIEIPYGQETYIYQAYVSNGTDELLAMRHGENIWGKLSFNFVAKSPKRRA